MNILSLLSAMLAAAFLIGGIYCATRKRKSGLNIFSLLVFLLLGWWSFCNAFFFSAETEETAMFWHHLAAIGWTGFIAETTYYFIILTNLHTKLKKLWMQIAFYALPAVLLIHNVFSDTTSLAVGVVKSRIWGQWAYVNSIENPWLWIYLVCLVLYFGTSFYLLIRWATRVKHRLKKRMAISFVALDALTILLGFVTDVLSPLLGQPIPSIANLCTAVFGAGYFFIIIRYDLFNVRRVVDDRVIIEHSMEPLMVIDETGELLDVNHACARILGKSRDELVGMSIRAFFEEKAFDSLVLASLDATDVVNDVEIPLLADKGEKKRLMIAGSVIRDQKNEYMGTVLSARDITQLTELKEQYKKLAYVDTLTGLPNRRSTFDYLKNREKNYSETGEDFFILYMDLDHFKAVNDQYGHNQGDQFLKMVAERLTECLGGNLKFLGRLSGDEFLMIGFPTCDESMIKDMLAAVKRRFDTAFALDDIRMKSGISIGYARYSDFENIDAMVHCADQKMYQIKQGERNSFRMREVR